MDFKFIILLILLVILIILIMSEFNSLRKEIAQHMKNSEDSIEKYLSILRGKLQADNIMSISKIRTYNDDLLQQIRNINMLESLHITNMSNHYTEGETDDFQKNNTIHHLSDANVKTLCESEKNVGDIFECKEEPVTNIPNKFEIKYENSASSSKSSKKSSILTIETTLKPMENYTLEQLKVLAKKKSVPITHIIDGSRKQLRKEELYNKLVSCSK